jgi:DNA-binding NarL/FixJ family response regulator
MSNQPLRIAIANDHELLRKTVANLLESNGFIVDQTTNGQQLIEHLESTTQTAPDVCIVDMNMPLLSGIETVKYIAKKWKIPVLIFSISVEEKPILQMLAQGACGYVFKGNPDELLEAISQVKEKGYYFSDLLCKMILKHLHSSVAV